MKRKSRPRLATARRTRRTLFSFILLGVAGIAIWLLQERVGLFAMIGDKARSLTSMVGELAQPRGIIFDRNFKQLAVTLDRVSVFARTQEIKSVPETAQTLGEILSLDEKELQQTLESGDLRVWVAEEISLEQEIAVKSQRLPGIYLQKSEKRFYPQGFRAAHILGYAENGIGLAGVEHSYDRVLTSGKRPQGHEERRFSSHDLVLTLDIKIQELLDAILAEVANDRTVSSALACLMEDKSGEVIAASQLPGFDPNNFAKFPKEVLANRLAMGVALPQRFRGLLRDVALLSNDDKAEGAHLPWSVRALGGDLGNQLRLWERLRLSDPPKTDFHMTARPGEGGEVTTRPLLPQDSSLALVPESASPLNILAAVATILNEGRPVWPQVAANHLGFGEEVLTGEPPRESHPAEQVPLLPVEVAELFRDQAAAGTNNSFFFRDEMPVVRGVGRGAQVQMLELLLVTIPAGGNDLLLLVVVESSPQGNSLQQGEKKMLLEQLVEEKVARISILQQVAKTVADVVEPEPGVDINYQKDQEDTNDREDSQPQGKPAAKARPRLTLMPDLQGQGLRQSLLLLQGAPLRLAIHGTGRIVSQKPVAGTPLEGVGEAVLILDKPEEVTPENLAKRAAAGK